MKEKEKEENGIKANGIKKKCKNAIGEIYEARHFNFNFNLLYCALFRADEGSVCPNGV